VRGGRHGALRLQLAAAEGERDALVAALAAAGSAAPPASAVAEADALIAALDAILGERESERIALLDQLGAARAAQRQAEAELGPAQDELRALRWQAADRAAERAQFEGERSGWEDERARLGVELRLLAAAAVLVVAPQQPSSQ
jgi:chromosome segregation ATPase